MQGIEFNCFVAAILITYVAPIIVELYKFFYRHEEMHYKSRITSKEIGKYRECSKSLDYEPGPIFPDKDLHDVMLEGIELMHKEGFSICESIRDSNL